MALLDLSDVSLIYGDGSAVVDVTAARALAAITVAGGGNDDTLRPVGSGDVEMVPITASETITAQAYLGDTLASLSSSGITDASAYVALILEASSTALLVPARLRDPVRRGLATEFGNQQVIRTSVSFAQRTAGTVDGIALNKVTANATVEAPGEGIDAWLVCTTAGTIDGAAQAVGIRQLDETQAPFVCAGGLRGWIVWALPHEVGTALVRPVVASDASTPLGAQGERISAANARLTLQVSPGTLVDYGLNEGRTGLRSGFPQDYRTRAEPGGVMAMEPLGYRAGQVSATVNRTRNSDRQLLAANQRYGVVTLQEGQTLHDATSLQFDCVIKRQLQLTPQGSAYTLTLVKTGALRDPIKA